MEWLTATEGGQMVFTFLVSMVPVIELRGAIPFGHNVLGLSVWQTFLASIVGNMVPVPFIIVYIRRIFLWMRRHMPRLDALVDALERKAHLKGQTVTRYKYLGLMVLVAIPLPGTGAWTGALAAAFLDMPLRRAIPAIFAGVVIAGLVVGILSFGVSTMFAM